MTVPSYSLSQKQRDVLVWVAQGCPDGVYEGYSHRVSARALHHKGLLSVKGHGKSWSATLTEEGTSYLHPGDHRDPGQPPATPVLPEAKKDTHPAKTPKDDKSSTTKNLPASAKKKKKPGVVDRMMAALQEADEHRIVIPAEQSNRYQLRAAAAEREGRIPDGMQITVNHDDHATAIVALEPLPAWQTAVLDPIAVPAQLHDPSDVTQTLSASETFEVKGPPRDRALRLVEALVTTARAQDFVVTAFVNQLVEQSRSNRRGVQRDGIEIQIERDIFRLWFTQDVVRTPYEPTRRELSQVRYGYLFPDFDETPEDNLGLVLDGKGRTFWANQWNDTEEHRLDDDLAQVLEEIQLRHKDLLEQRQQEQKRLEIQLCEHEEELAHARVKYREAFLVEAMHTQAQQWEQASRLRRYAQAAREQAELFSGAERAQAVAWADQLHAQADACDPLRKGVRPPAIPEPSSADLQPFLPRRRSTRW